MRAGLCVPAGDGVEQRAVVRGAVRPVARTQGAGRQAGLPRAREGAGIGAVGEHTDDARVQPTRGDGV